MKYILVALFSTFTLLIQSCHSKKFLSEAKSQTIEQRIGPKMTFDKTIVDFGDVKKGEKRKATYSFTNTGDEALVIEIATTCHCTSIVYPQGKTINPNEGGVFEIEFDSGLKEKSGTVDITIVLENTDKNDYPLIEELFFKYVLIE